jgi:colicin import membrane protein
MDSLPPDANRWIASQPEPIPVGAGVLALAVHVGFAAVLMLNMNWQHHIQPSASIKLWESMPTTSVKPTKRSKPTPRRAPEPVSEPAPKPVATPAEPAPAPTPQLDVPPPAAALPPLPADLAAPLREKVDQAPPPQPVNPLSEQPQPSLAPPPIEEQPAPTPEVDVAQMKRERALALAEKLRHQESERLADSLDKERESRLAQAQELREEREQRVAQQLSEIRVPTEQPQDEPEAQNENEAAARAITDDYRARISARIRQRVILPPDLQGNPEAIYTVSLLPGGTVTEVRLLKTSGVATYDAAVERAILAAQPLPVPEDPAMFQANFKNLRLNFRPKK